MNEIYEFKVKVYDQNTNLWSEYSLSSNPLDTRIRKRISIEKLICFKSVIFNLNRFICKFRKNK